MESSGTLLKGKWVLVTGASKGLGEAIAMTYAKQGASIALAARSEDKLQAVRRCTAYAYPHMKLTALDMKAWYGILLYNLYNDMFGVARDL